MHEQLLGYLLGALEAEEQREVESRLAVDPEWQAELARLKSALAPLQADREHHAPPAGLAARTCEQIFSQESGEIEVASRSIEQELSGGRSRWRPWDVVVAGGIIAATILLFFPAVLQSRYAAELASCQNNLRELGVALVGYDQSHQQMPCPAKERALPVAGMYAPILVQGGYVNDERFFVCPNSALAAQVGGFHVPRREDLSKGVEIAPAQRATLGGSYGYSLGYLRDGVYGPMRNQHRAQFAVMSDAPSKHLPDLRSANHRGRGQNVLFENGRVAYLVTVTLSAESNDVLFLSDRGRVEPGRHPSDIVIAGSDTPVPELIEQ